MKIACLSGKGGAGKTFVSVNLAAAAGKCTYIDCDVEEPNGHLFLSPQNVEIQVVSTLLPSIDEKKCTGCRRCVDFCKFNALVFIKNKPMVFSEVCHSCGGCKIVCQENAITEVPKSVGVLEIGSHNEISVVSGVLNTGEASGVPIIHKALEKSSEVTILDCPPGSACSVMESIMDVDYCVLVAEPTAFGFHNFKMVYELASLLKRKCGVVINKETERYQPLEEFCINHNLEILDRISYDENLGNIIANGQIAFEVNDKEHERFAKLFSKIGGLI